MIEPLDIEIVMASVSSTTLAPKTPITTPITPPITDNKNDSIKNCTLMSEAFAPIAIRMPISLVLSVTDTSIIFIIPIPPTNRDTDAIAPRRIDMVRAEDLIVSCISAKLRISKSSS